MKPFRTKGVLLDLGGVVFAGDAPIAGSLEAVERLKTAPLPIRFITNTTSRSRRKLLDKLVSIGLTISPTELLTPAQLVRGYLINHQLKPHLLVHENLEEEFTDLPAAKAEAVVIGDARERFNFANLNMAYRKLEGGAEFLALAANRNFLDDDGELSLDAGAFVKALEYASSREAKVLGKPARDFFELACQSLQTAANETVMIGDDAEADVGGAMAAGLHGILVRTGKYKIGEEQKSLTPPDLIADDLASAVDWLLGGRS